MPFFREIIYIVSRHCRPPGSAAGTARAAQASRMPLADRATGVAVGIGRGGRGPGRWMRIARRWALALTLASLLIGGCGRQAAAPPSRALPVAAPAGRLQEVPPPGAVEQIEAALALPGS